MRLPRSYQPDVDFGGLSIRRSPSWRSGSLQTRTCCSPPQSLTGLADMLGLRAPGTFREAGDLLTLARVAQEPCRPERAWLSASGVYRRHPGGTCSA